MSYSKIPDDLFQLAFVGGWNEGLPELKEMAEEEDWDFSSTSKGDNSVLKHYIRHTYGRLVEEGKIETNENGNSLCFNTGLVTENQEEIFALFVPNRKPDHSEKWFLNGWKKASDNNLQSFASLPHLAQYFEKITDLLFDSSLEIRINYDHIVVEHKDRFPDEFAKMDNHRLIIALRGAIEAAKARVRRNYKTAIPQYYSKRIQLLLPICLRRPRKADVALVVETEEWILPRINCSNIGHGL